MKPTFKKKLAASIRRDAGMSGTGRIKVVSGHSGAKSAGRSYHHTNKSGQLIKFPNAYRKAKGNPIYQPSTKHIKVGMSAVKQKIRKLRSK